MESNVHPPKGDSNAPFQILVTNIDYNDYIGRIATGKIFSGKVKTGETLAVVKHDGSIVKGRISKLLGYEGLKQVEIEEAMTGDIVSIAGFEDVGIGETLAIGRRPYSPAVRFHRRTDHLHELHRQLFSLCRP